MFRQEFCEAHCFSLKRIQALFEDPFLIVTQPTYQPSTLRHGYASQGKPAQRSNSRGEHGDINLTLRLGPHRFNAFGERGALAPLPASTSLALRSARTGEGNLLRLKGEGR
jgi:hypothetical protein